MFRSVFVLAIILVSGAALAQNQTVNGNLTVNGMSNLNGSATVSGVLNLIEAGTVTNGFQEIHENQNFSGTANDGASINLIQASSDTINDPNGSILVAINSYFGGASMTGVRNTLLVKANLTATTGNTTSGTSFSAAQIFAEAFVNDNGTGVTGTTAKGDVFAINNVAHLGPKATDYQGLVAQEADIYAEKGSSVLDKIGIQIVEVGGDAVQGTRV